MKDALAAREVVGTPNYPRKAFLKTTFKCFLLLSLLTIPIGFILVPFPSPLSRYQMYNGSADGPAKFQKALPLPRNDPLRLSTQHNMIYPGNYHFILDDTELCRSIHPYLVLIVPVAPGNWKARDAIRRTWGNETHIQGELIQTVFLLGIPNSGNIEVLQRKVRTENRLYHDLIQSDFIDSYHNLTIKTMVIMDWLASRCPMVPYAMKIDSDMFLNVENLVSMLKTPGTPTTIYMTGRLKYESPVVRKKNSKWYVSEYSYRENKFPTHLVGMGYVFSLDMPRRLMEISKRVTPFYVEDAYIGVCMKTLGIDFTPPPERNQFRLYMYEFNHCHLAKSICAILQTPEQLINYWTSLKGPGPAC
ncbi:beta-1,3-galactosyltransferase 2-like isoform X1 [Gadus morhua]|uniref:Hexosyltransferase n=2 Tax=Gadus morhua TaxID=8049 RepID=A0A8C5BFN5_GADMO|nr:beta-1,3-galactosyltransferase 2-like isoform X1 [Gadus morhua]